jgi:hypothetical protein
MRKRKWDAQASIHILLEWHSLSTKLRFEPREEQANRNWQEDAGFSAPFIQGVDGDKDVLFRIHLLDEHGTNRLAI